MARAGNTIQINISVPTELADKLKAIAAEENRSLSNWCSVELEVSAAMWLKEKAVNDAKV